MVLTPSGVVLTNNHVVQGATRIAATDIGNGRTYTATVVGYDRSGDVAVIQLRGASGLRTVPLGDIVDACRSRTRCWPSATPAAAAARRGWPGDG